MMETTDLITHPLSVSPLNDRQLRQIYARMKILIGERRDETHKISNNIVGSFWKWNKFQRLAAFTEYTRSLNISSDNLAGRNKKKVG